MTEEDDMDGTVIRSERVTLTGVEEFDPGSIDIDQLAIGLIAADRRDRWRCVGCRGTPVLAYVENYRLGEGSTFALCATCLFDRLGRNCAPAELAAAQEAGDLMRSSTATLTAWIGEHHDDLPSEVRRAAVEAAAALDSWDCARRASRARVD